MKILLTGGAGFIGSWLTESLTKDENSVTVIDNLSPQIHGTFHKDELPWLRLPGVTFHHADVRDHGLLDSVLAKVDAVVHLAAETGTGQSMYQIRHYYDVNVQATAALFELIGTKHRHIKRVVLASSRSIYGEGAYELNGQLYVPKPRSNTQLDSKKWEPTGPNGEVLKLIATPEIAPAHPASIYAATKLANEQLAQVFSDA